MEGVQAGQDGDLSPVALSVRIFRHGTSKMRHSRSPPPNKYPRKQAANMKESRGQRPKKSKRQGEGTAGGGRSASTLDQAHARKCDKGTTDVHCVVWCGVVVLGCFSRAKEGEEGAMGSGRQRH